MNCWLIPLPTERSRVSDHALRFLTNQRVRAENCGTMSFVSKDSIEVTAQSIGINNLSPDVAVSFVPHVENWLREIMQVL